MASGFVIRKNQYYDLVFLMSVNRAHSESPRHPADRSADGQPGEQTALRGDWHPGQGTNRNTSNHDLIVAVIAENSGDCGKCRLERLDEWLDAKQETSAALKDKNARNLRACPKKQNANLAVISVPGSISCPKRPEISACRSA